MLGAIVGDPNFDAFFAQEQAEIREYECISEFKLLAAPAQDALALEPTHTVIVGEVVESIRGKVVDGKSFIAVDSGWLPLQAVELVTEGDNATESSSEASVSDEDTAPVKPGTVADLDTKEHRGSPTVEANPEKQPSSNADKSNTDASPEVLQSAAGEPAPITSTTDTEVQKAVQESESCALDAEAARVERVEKQQDEEVYGANDAAGSDDDIIE